MQVSAKVMCKSGQALCKSVSIHWVTVSHWQCKSWTRHGQCIVKAHLGVPALYCVKDCGKILYGAVKIQPGQWLVNELTMTITRIVWEGPKSLINFVFHFFKKIGCLICQMWQKRFWLFLWALRIRCQKRFLAIFAHSTFFGFQSRPLWCFWA